MKITIQNDPDPNDHKLYRHKCSTEICDGSTAADALRECVSLLVCAGYTYQSVDEAVEEVAAEMRSVRGNE